MGILLGIIIVFKAYEPKLKGKIGEGRVNSILGKLPEGYIILKDLLLETDKGTTQIDHVVVCEKGIFVIETKNYDGWIYGSENQKYWTQVIYKTKNKFFNPIWQNKGHISAIKKGLAKFDLPIYSVIAFGGGCTFKKIDCETPVMYMGKLKKYIINFTGEGYLGLDEVNSIGNKLRNLNITDYEKRKEHIRQVRMKK